MSVCPSPLSRLRFKLQTTSVNRALPVQPPPRTFSLRSKAFSFYSIDTCAKRWPETLLDPLSVIRPTFELSKLSMLPGFLESTYKKYKNDTSLLVKWLCEAGSRCGFAISRTNTAKEEPVTKAPRLKGKARKEAKQASNSRFPGGS